MEDSGVPPLAADVLASAGRGLVAWYDGRRRSLPWRAGPGERADPYHVLVSEVMLQQTTVAVVAQRFRPFVARWPTIEALASAPREDVLAAWAGLGYYARARRLHDAARAIVAHHGGVFPTDETGLRALPGIGAYASAAVAAIAFERPAVVIDGNVERVMARWLGLDVPPRTARPRLASALEAMRPTGRSGDFAQAMMDLGATICRPRRADCTVCPLATGCAARHANPLALPVKDRPASRMALCGHAFVLWDRDGRVLVRRRGPHGLLAGMLGLPGGPWQPAPGPAPAEPPCPAPWRPVDARVTHVFTHRVLELSLSWAVTEPGPAPAGFLWHGAMGELPALDRKAVRLAEDARRSV